MDKRWDIIEEIFELTGEHAANCLAQPLSGSVRIKGKFIRGENGRLRPVLVKTTYLPVYNTPDPEAETNPWSIVTPSASTTANSGPLVKQHHKQHKWYSALFSRFQEFITR
ncbi:hypothetical protein Desca_0529 [Desulfotomaculum nigrificans CO-1-SRB]|uniref:Uncharacterized protein n=1 Tax=Desulfotomaculum nigrificans (strain DSM 14880 / VKM B-2319 / CO-1-SRB) TaxID=868595 RepID=F6B7P9_DESCC|nr:hypothetical protein [Desulfotomaculum nigrificans]AEF93421.1 hypothetical protein Desca_0529 [Desulfotomaculum nigrificans CO-1-SRB]